MRKNWLRIFFVPFAGGELSEHDKDAVMLALQDAYWMAKERNKEKYTPNKYRKAEEVEDRDE